MTPTVNNPAQHYRYGCHIRTSSAQYRSLCQRTSAIPHRRPWANRGNLCNLSWRFYVLSNSHLWHNTADFVERRFCSLQNVPPSSCARRYQAATNASNKGYINVLTPAVNGYTSCKCSTFKPLCPPGHQSHLPDFDETLKVMENVIM